MIEFEVGLITFKLNVFVDKKLETHGQWELKVKVKALILQAVEGGLKCNMFIIGEDGLKRHCIFFYMPTKMGLFTLIIYNLY